MKPSSVNKLFLIYVYEFYNGSYVRMFDAISRGETNYNYDFGVHTYDENKQFLLDWKKHNHIALCDYELCAPPKLEKGIPIFIKKLVREV